MSLQETTTHVSKFKGTTQAGSTLPTDGNSGLAGLPGKGQQFYDQGANQMAIHKGSGVWVKEQYTTTSTSTS